MPNDDKYGRLYPERAVAPARQALQAILADLHDPKAPWSLVEGALRALDEQGFPQDEPLFLLRGQDVLAPETVRGYAEDAAAAGAFHIGDGEPRGEEAFKQFMEFAARMERWQPRKLPD